MLIFRARFIFYTLHQIAPAPSHITTSQLSHAIHTHGYLATNAVPTVGQNSAVFRPAMCALNSATVAVASATAFCSRYCFALRSANYCSRLMRWRSGMEDSCGHSADTKQRAVARQTYLQLNF